MSKPKKNQSLDRFAVKIKKIREQLGLALDEVAQEIGVKEAYVQQMEAAERGPSKTVLKKLASILSQENLFVRDQLYVLAGFPPPQSKGKNQTYEALLRNSNPDDFESYLNLVNTLIKSGELEAANKHIETGFAVYNETLELQMLVAFLELTRKDFKAALLAVQNAIDFKREGIDSDYPLAELLLNQGVVYFFQGSNFLTRRYQAPGEEQAKLGAQAMECFQQALQCYLQGLEEDDRNILLLDEAARVSFNIADLLDDEAAQPYWQNTILLFREVLASDNKGTLGQNNLRESGCFLAHAYTKSGQWVQAREALSLITTYQPEHWFAYYVGACHHALYYEANKDPEALERALHQLDMAEPYMANIFNMALHEPDLKAIRQQIKARIKKGTE